MYIYSGKCIDSNVNLILFTAVTLGSDQVQHVSGMFDTQLHQLYHILSPLCMVNIYTIVYKQ